MRLFISGTNTEVGKTYFSALLAEYFQNQGKSVKYIKPVQTGFPTDNDAEFVMVQSKLPADNAEVLYTAEPPVAPCLVFDKFPLKQVIEKIDSEKDCDVLIVEGAGGIAVPLDYDTLTYEIPLQCGLDTILVVPNRLGCINDSVLNVRFLENNKIKLLGLALNNYYTPEKDETQNSMILEKILPGMVKFEFSEKLSRVNI